MKGQKNEIPALISELFEQEAMSREAMAARLGVSLAALMRWASGQSRPHPPNERVIRKLMGKHTNQSTVSHVFQPALQWSEDNEFRIREAITQTLKQAREILHRSGRLSSRHEALDELSKLLFAHILTIDRGGDGITHSILERESGPAESLRKFVSSCFNKYLPISLSHEIGPGDFDLKFRPTEDRFALELIGCFQTYAPSSLFSAIRKAGELDILNDTFGNFLADSFIDEKELGQYLTPAEVIRFMVRIGLDSLRDSDLNDLCDPNGNDFLIIDPSCGVGSFLAEVIRQLYARVKRNASESNLERWLDKVVGSSVLGIDKSERMIRLALTNLALFGASSVNLHLANSLVRAGNDAKVTDTLKDRAKLILTNPPFGAEYSGHDLIAYKIATEWTDKFPKKVDSELLFFERYIDWLAPGGVLVAIIPDSILTNRGLFASLRKGVGPLVELLSVVSLPKVTFGVAGTNTKTSIIHLRKNVKPTVEAHKAYFAVCENIGYDVSTRGSHRHKVSNGKSDLVQIASEITSTSNEHVGHFVEVREDESRWDATYHAKLPAALQKRLESRTGQLRVKDVAALSDERADPRRFGTDTFNYIEISDIEAKTCSVWSKEVECAEAPSRARKRVRAGDVLVSTVRPERRAVGVVPDGLDKAICSTGFAVLRCRSIEPHILARLVQSDFVNGQILRNNVGVAYPAIDEECLLDVILPVSKKSVDELAEEAKGLESARQNLDRAEERIRAKIKETECS